MTIDDLEGASRAYFDANVFIYLIEGAETFRSIARKAFQVARDTGLIVISSELTRAECFYGAAKKGDAALIARYRALFETRDAVTLFPVDLAILDHAALHGPRRRLKLIDAVHVATAAQTGCDAFLTNDRGIRSTDGLSLIYLTP